ncbi:MAG: hypothetical protein KBD16_01725 [Candidatus Pacebacteria bacterium]|nr:hypothetical protein [Candidatus Paceibacterota bacterium]
MNIKTIVISVIGLCVIGIATFFFLARKSNIQDTLESEVFVDATEETQVQKESRAAEQTAYWNPSDSFVVDELVLENGEKVQVILGEMSIEQTNPSELYGGFMPPTSSNNCLEDFPAFEIPTIRTRRVGLRYRNKDIFVGEIGVPDRKNGAWQTTELSRSAGVNEMATTTYEWKPARMMGNLLVVTDYAPLQASWVGEFNQSICAKLPLTLHYFKLYDDGFFGIYDSRTSEKVPSIYLYELFLWNGWETNQDKIFDNGCTPLGCG